MGACCTHAPVFFLYRRQQAGTPVAGPVLIVGPLLLAVMNSSLATVWRWYNLKACNRTRTAGLTSHGAGMCACGLKGKTKTKAIACAWDVP